MSEIGNEGREKGERSERAREAVRVTQNRDKDYVFISVFITSTNWA